MNEKEVALWSEGGLNVTLTIRLLMHGKVRLANPCIINVYELFQVIINSLLKVESTPDYITIIRYQSGSRAEIYTITTAYMFYCQFKHASLF